MGWDKGVIGFHDSINIQMERTAGDSHISHHYAALCEHKLAVLVYQHHPKASVLQ